MIMAANLLDVRNASQAHELLLQLDKREKEVMKELDKLLEKQTQLDIKMASFQYMLPNLSTLSSNSAQLSTSITQASLLAESVSRKVRVLDLAKGHVYAAMRQVDDVIDLKSCVDGVQYCMKSGDFEKAAAHINRYLSLDQAMFQEAFPPSGQDVSSASSFKLLKQNEDQLKQLVRSKFKEAAEVGDSKGAERFFKIYPLLHLHKEGLEGYSFFLRSQLKYKAGLTLDSALTNDTSGERSGFIFADALSQLFEEIAGVVEHHQPIVEAHYGVEWMPFLIQQLQEECDVQVEKIIGLLKEERSLANKISTVTMALKSRDTVGAIRPDVLELDVMLTELSLCSSCSELYFRFLKRKLSPGAGSSEDPGSMSNQFLSGCGTSRTLQELICKYIVLENYFMSESLSKAVRMCQWSASSLTSSMADDIFFVLQKCIKRAFASSNVDCTCAMLNHARTLLEEDYRIVLQARLKDSLPTSVAGLDLSRLDLSVMLQGRLPNRSGTENESTKPSCMVALNDVEVSIENIQKLTKDLEMESTKLITQRVGGSTANKLQSCLGDLSSSIVKLKQLRQEGIAKLLEMVIMPRIKPALDVFSSLEHILTEEKMANFEVNDPFVHQLVNIVQATLDEVKASFLQQMYEQVVLDTVAEMASYLEQLVLKSSFNQLGGLQLDKDLRCLLGYLSSLTPWPVRDKFARLSQMATILSLGKVGEMLDFWGESAGPLVWRLTPGEVRLIMGLRTDFNADEINRLKL